MIQLHTGKLYDPIMIGQVKRMKQFLRIFGQWTGIYPYQNAMKSLTIYMYTLIPNGKRTLMKKIHTE